MPKPSIVDFMILPEHVILTDGVSAAAVAHIVLRSVLRNGVARGLAEAEAGILVALSCILFKNIVWGRFDCEAGAIALTG